MSTHPDLHVLSMREAEAYTPTQREVCISIIDPHGRQAQLSDAFLDVLRLEFDDVERAVTDDDVECTPAQAERVLAFATRWCDVDRIVIHCHAGRSRSPAVALGIATCLGIDPRAIEERYPAFNRDVRRLLVSAAAGRAADPTSPWMRLLRRVRVRSKGRRLAGTRVGRTG